MGLRAVLRTSFFLLFCFQASASAEPAEDRPNPKGSAYDIQHYHLEVLACPDSGRIKSSAEVTIRASDNNPTDSLDLLLDEGLNVLSVSAAGQPLPFRRVINAAPVMDLHPNSPNYSNWAFIRISPELFRKSRKQKLRIQYEGSISVNTYPAQKCLFYDNIWSRWYPLRYDDPATCEYEVRVPDSFSVIIGGRTTRRKVGNGKDLYSAKTDISLNFLPLLAGPWKQHVIGTSAVPLIRYRLFADSVNQNEAEKAGEYLQFLTGLLGDYPYRELSLVEYPLAGEKFDEAIPGGIVTTSGDMTPEVFVHELSHLWWGAGIFAAHDRDLGFLNEAFASYTGALYREKVSGAADMMNGFVKAQTHNHSRSAGQYDLSYIPLNYWKGALSLHLLRRVMGDQAFFRAVRNHARSNIGKVQSLSVLRQNFEKEHGNALGWFFDQWVHRTGLPDLELTYSSMEERSGNHTISVSISQKKQTYDLPVDLDFFDAQGKLIERKALWIREPKTEFKFNFDRKIGAVILDPENWIPSVARMMKLLNINAQ